MILTDKAIRSSAPKDSVYRLREVGGGVKGFGITIAPAGSKTFFLGYTAPGTRKRTQINLGRYPSISLKDARQKAHDARESLSRGIDPREQAKAQAIANEALKNRGTVSDLFDLYVRDLELDKKRSSREVRRIYEKHIGPMIGNQLVADTTADDILDVVTPIVRRGSSVHADNVRAYLRAAFELGIHAKNIARWRGQIPNFDIAHNPVAATRRAVKRKPVGTRSLDWMEVSEIWSAPGLSHSSRLSLKLLISTGQRVEEVLHASWNEFDLAENLWIIPAERRKTRSSSSEPHVVPLTAFHTNLLDQVKATNEQGDWLFPHQDRTQPRNADALCQATRRFCERNRIKGFAPRDCRRTFKTLTGSIGIDLELRNRLQGHAMTDVGSVHYDRWSYLPQKREAMSIWAQTLKENLVPEKKGNEL
jgi:integrase|tara:strand:+ start:206 stop:1465 length:1260 start_codon:yes stop_codon:yes gene_type:complete